MQNLYMLTASVAVPHDPVVQTRLILVMACSKIPGWGTIRTTLSSETSISRLAPGVECPNRA